MERNKIKIRELLTGEKLRAELSMLPKYIDDVRNQEKADRLMALADIFTIYVPSYMTEEIYSRLYMALFHSLQKKNTVGAVMQANENNRRIYHKEYRGIIGGSDSFTIIGVSGLGKSSAISRSIEIISTGRVIECRKPYVDIIPFVLVQCPFDASVKGLLLSILSEVDSILGSDYCEKAEKNRATTDMLIGFVSQIAMNHIGVLIVDEIQNVVSNKNGRNLVGMLTQLINSSGISVCMVGTPECSEFFESVLQLARRSVGLNYGVMEYDSYFYSFCSTVFSYQYTKNKTKISDSIVRWLYEHSGGITSVVVSLIHDAQEIAILSGREELCIETLNQAYKQRLSMLHGFIDPTVTRMSQTHTKTKRKYTDASLSLDEPKRTKSITELVTEARSMEIDIISFLKKNVTVEEIEV